MEHGQSSPEKQTTLIFLVRAFQYRNYRLFFSGQGISLVGTWMQQIAVSWLVYRLTNSPFLLGFIGFAGQVPTFVLAPVAGVFADRWDRRKLLVMTQVLAMLQAFLLAFLVVHWPYSGVAPCDFKRVPGSCKCLGHPGPTVLRY